ncbi:hypothetical protein WMY93_014877 [Mugilogobius chulae]|uniref:Mono(ADP-ribosyl)transferase n=1 Tax=Mugilogobius chulae TaxID=88201 RepID=A0AAW0P0G3_9GOBI
MCQSFTRLMEVGRTQVFNASAVVTCRHRLHEVPDMETTMLALMLCLVLPTFAVDFPFALTMMDQSVDDKYDGCREKMIKKVENEDFPREMKNNWLFKNAWEKTKTLANQEIFQD